jgi:hydroxymethylpyrimidine pyrophosphatase-like HAD family hydrolase
MNAVGYTLEFNASRIDKGKGVQILADHYGIDRKHIIAIGDSQNDLPMFCVASIKVAMGNAISLIKARSSFITLDCDHDGVAYSMAPQLSLFS